MRSTLFSSLALGDVRTDTFTPDTQTPWVIVLCRQEQSNSCATGQRLDSATISVQSGLVINDVAVAEGTLPAGRTTPLTFTVTRAGTTGTSTVAFATSAGTATAGLSCLTAGVDYLTTAGTLTFGSGVATQTVTVQACRDASPEADETFNVNLSAATNAVITDAQGVGTITNDDVSFSINDVTLNEGNAGTTSFTFTVTKSGTVAGTGTVDVATANDTAVAPGDYTALSPAQTLTFAAGDTTQTVTVLVNGDTTVEPTEQFFVNLSNASGGATITDAQGVGTITNDDVSFSINDVTLNEGNAGTTSFIFTITKTGTVSGSSSVDYATANATAVAAGDYTALPTSTLTFLAGETTKTVTVSVNGDDVYEANETFNLNLSNANNATISDAQGVGTINNDDAQPTLAINDVSVTEGNGTGTTNLTFTVTRTGASELMSSVDWATAAATATGGSCVSGADYQSASGTLFIPGGVGSATITISVCRDDVYEANETFNLNLSNANNATISDAQGVGTINNDDAQPTLAINDVSTVEGNGFGTTILTFTVTRTGASELTSSVDWATAAATATGGTCVSGADYQSASGTLLIPGGGNSSASSFTILVCRDDVYEANETFTVNLSNATNATVSDTSGVGTINNDDAQPTLAINDVSVTEGNGTGTTNLTFTVTRTGASELASTVDWTTASGTATGGGGCSGAADYESASGTVSIPGGANSGTITISVCRDDVYEANETFNLNLSNANNATISDAQGVGTINNDDAQPTLAINDVSVTEGNGTGTTNLTFTVTRTGASELMSSVDWATAAATATGGSCVSGADYQSASGTLFIPGGVGSATITISVCRDDVYEANETFNLNLSNANNATISDASGDGTITNDDAKPTLAINDVTKAEGDSGTTSFTFTVTKTGATAVTATVNWATAAGTATAGTSCTTGVDYITDSDTLSFGAAETSKSITVLVCGEAVYEADQTFLVNLSGASHATIDDAQGVGTITNDDAKPTLAINDVTAAEGDLPGTTTFTFTVTKSGLTELSASVNWATADDTALGDAACDPGVDYLDASGSLTFAAR